MNKPTAVYQDALTALNAAHALAQAGSKGNIEVLSTDLLEVMRHTVHGPMPTEEEASVIANGVVSAFCQKWETNEPRFVEYFNTQWQPKIGDLILQIWLSKASL